MIFSNIPTTSKRKRFKIEGDRGVDFSNSVFQNFLKQRTIQHYSRFTDKSPSIAKRVTKTIRIFWRNQYFNQGRVIG